MNESLCSSLVFARAGGRCERCGSGYNLSRHHRKKRSQGGTWTPENVALVCGSGTTGCHGWIEANPNKAEAEGWHVRPWEDPGEVPIKRYRSEWCILLPDGDLSDSEPRELAAESWGLPDDIPGERERRGEDNLENDRVIPD